MNWNAIQGQVQSLIGQHAGNQIGTGFNPTPLLAEVQQLFSQQAATPEARTDPNGLLSKVKSLIGQHATNQSETGFNPSALLSDVENLFHQEG